ncbi:MAG: hypothetical protein BM564_10600 [Bacteroidetes bacterium MedPE-SWsnd-G2]|nr:MAG: hypothetical protein BM564_10600 [Bacteroidetes bacterium MedPE-SWsnd-G2]
MKKTINSIFIFTFFALSTLFFQSCQDEEIQVTQPTEEEAIIAQSTLAVAMQSACSYDTAADDFLDNANCLGIDLPVTVTVNDITITINTLEDLELVEDIFDEFEDDEDILEFLFPITIVLNDYTEIVIEDEDALEALIDECTDEPESIECIDFQYPISFSIFNTEFQLIDSVVVTDDSELYDFLENLNEETDQALLASLDFPVTMVYANGETVVVNNNQELEDVIVAAEQDCDDYDDDFCTEEDVNEVISECYWMIDVYNGDDVFENLEVYFNEDGTLQIIDGETQVAIGGAWSISQTDIGVVISISELTAFQGDLGGEWLIVECDDDEFVLIKETENGVVTLVIEQECEDDEDDCSAQEINSNLQECQWWGFSNLYDNVQANIFTFTPNGAVIISTENSDEVLTGMYQVELTATGVVVVLELPEPYNVLNMSWDVTECDEYYIHLQNGDNFFGLERDCNDDDEYDCEDLQANYGDDCITASGVEGYLNEDCECVVETNDDSLGCLESEDIELCDEGNDGVEVFNLYAGLDELEDCEIDSAVSVSFHETIMDAEANVNSIPSATQYTNISNPQTVYVRIELSNDPSQFEVLEIGLYLENCQENEFECFQMEAGSQELESCDNTNGVMNDGIAVFDLTLAFQECLANDNIEYAYYASVEDLENNNPISNPSEFLNQPNTPYAILKVISISTGETAIFEFPLEVEYCESEDLECFEDVNVVQLEACDSNDSEPNNGSAYFNLTEAFDDCYEPSMHTVTYHEMAQDAYDNVNPIAIPEEYLNTPNTQIVYVRVETANGDYGVYEIILWVQDCEASCSEEDVDGFLMECHWVPEYINGSDDFNGFNFYFNDGQELIVVSDNETSTGNWQTFSGGVENGVVVVMTGFTGPLQAFIGEWEVVECGEEQLIMHNMGNDEIEIVFTRECN